MNSKKIIKHRYEVTVYDRQEVTTKSMTRDQVMQINPQSFDYFLSLAFGIWAFRTAEDKWIAHEAADWPGIGNTGIKIIQATQLNPREFLIPAEIAELTGCATLRNSNALSARLKAIREAHKESFKYPNFFLSRRDGGFAIAWNAEKTWAWIERIRPVLETVS
jgi:hypothetical protein